ncbi:putative F-box protein At3g16210 [Salvia hispanica]|uniref:putative F-box protein At3g16210 n=1 Tax=Salvia hispanica TaxID=49212 RepID=UPI0020091071|nr:putative F-box protein At3g16210 [Salvia hispanica]
MEQGIDLEVMKEDLFTNLPVELTRDIMRRVSISSILNCMDVCKSWRDLIDEDEFKASYTSRRCLAFSYEDIYIVWDDKACEPLFRFWMSPPYIKHQSSVRYRVVVDSTDGLLLVRDGRSNILFVCNPLTCEYVVLPPLPTFSRRCMFGFGVSRISGQYKILCGEESGSCHVYTLEGEGSWRSISTLAPGGSTVPGAIAAFVNGNLHWLASDSEENHLVCCFDLETKLFTSFSLPPRVSDNDILDEYWLCILEGRLCLCDHLNGYGVVILWTNNSRDKNDWVKEYTTHLPQDIKGHVFPLKVLDNGDLLFAMKVYNRLFNFSKNTKDVVTHSHVQRSIYDYANIAIYTPNFLSLKAMGIHNVQSLTYMHY